MLVDNAVYGLGMNESAKVIKILHDYTFDGNLVITCISQTNQNTFAMFDKLWILDEEGYPIYNNSTFKAPGYFKNNLKIVGINESSNEHTPEYILELINFRISDSSGRRGKRKVSPLEWNNIYCKNKASSYQSHQIETLPLPANYIKVPNLETQFKIFSLRNFKVKFTDSINLIYTLLTGPLIAFVLGIILRQKTSGEYNFSENSNIPLYLFASSIISIFFGLFLSVKEILKERNILRKEEYLEFSRFSYINSKIAFLFIIAAIQTFLYVFTGNFLLGVKEMNLQFWLILFSSCCFGVILGLNLSKIHKTLNGIYEKSIPIIIILNILLGGGIISYEKLDFNKGPFVPLLGEIMISRWAYEALVVEQYKSNHYEKLLYEYDKTLSTSYFYSFHLIPQLQLYLTKSIDNNFTDDSLGIYLNIIKNSIENAYTEAEIFEFEFLDSLNSNDFDAYIGMETKDYLTYLDIHFYNSYNKAVTRKTNFIKNLKDSIGNDEFTKLIKDNNNLAIEKLVKNNNASKPWRIYKNKIYQLSDPIFQKPGSNFGRAMFFSPQKRFRGEVIDTLWFNFTFIWLFSFALYILLIIDLPSFLNRIFNNY